MTFADLLRRLLENLRHRVQSGEATERSLARLAGLSQPHLHNALKGKRLLSLDMADRILNNLEIGVVDLISAEEFSQWHRRRRG
jgi:transcriptional regulator with XRE-family HTH domain